MLNTKKTLLQQNSSVATNVAGPAVAPSPLGATASTLAGLADLLRSHAPANVLDTAPLGTDADPHAQLDMTPQLGADPDDDDAEREIPHPEAAAARHLPLASDQPALFMRGVGPGGHGPGKQGCGSLLGGRSGQSNIHS